MLNQEMIELANNILTQTAFISMIIFIFFYIKEGKDERGGMIFNVFFRSMFVYFRSVLSELQTCNSGSAFRMNGSGC